MPIQRKDGEPDPSAIEMEDREQEKLAMFVAKEVLSLPLEEGIYAAYAACLCKVFAYLAQ